MTGSIKLFEFVQKCYQFMGIHSFRINLLNPKNLLFLVFPSTEMISMIAYILYKADSAKEYNSAFYLFNTNFGFTIYYLIIIWKMPNILQLIEQFQEFIEISASEVILIYQG